MEPINVYTAEHELEQKTFMTKVYMWMSGGLALTAIVAMYVASSEMLIRMFLSNMLVFFGLVIGEVLLVGYLATRINDMTVDQARLTFFGYSALNGITLSVLFLVYTSESIATTFLMTSGTFFLMSLYGFTTKKDLTSIGNLAMTALIGIIIASVVNIFLNSSSLYWAISYIGVLVFVGLIAYDTQKIKNMNVLGNSGTAEDTKEAIMGALTLYLDFINLFIMLLRIFGNRRD